MYAIIRSGSRQYQVQPETIIAVNHLALEQGAAFETDQVLLLEHDGAEVRIGAPLVPGAVVKGRVLQHLRGRKVLIFKHKRRKNYRRTRGHRQELTRVLIESIELDGKLIAGAKPAPRAAPKPKSEPKGEREPAAAAGTAPAAEAPAPKGKAAAKPKASAKPAATPKAKAAPKPKAGKPAPKAAAGKAPSKRAPAGKAGGKTPAKAGGKGAGKSKPKKD
jgi:large subunit ribosomal protein L21